MTSEDEALWARVQAIPKLRLRTRQVVGGSGPDTFEDCVRVADLRAAGLLPPLPPPTCIESGCDAPRIVPEADPIWCEPHRDATYAKQQAWMIKTRRPAPTGKPR